MGVYFRRRFEFFKLLTIFLTEKLDWKVEVQFFFTSETSKKNVKRVLYTVQFWGKDEIFCHILQENENFRSSFS